MISEFTPLLRRAADMAMDVASKTTEQPVPGHGPEQRSFYSWAWIVGIINLCIFIPFFILINYTFEKIIPVLAIVEDEHPPAYEPVALDDESSGSIPGVPAPAGGVPKPASAAVPTRPLHIHDAEPITKSLLSTWRLLRSHGGWRRAMFRGFWCLTFQSIIQNWLTFGFGRILGPAIILASLASTLLLVSFSTAWVHIVLTPPSPLPFWRRLPAFSHTFQATWRPVLLFWGFTQATAGITLLLVWVLGLSQEKSGNWDIPATSQGWKYALVYVVAIVLRIFVMVPAYVTLVRVQASLLPDNQETIIPFDRSFQGRVEPAVLGGTGYVSVTDAWATFSKAAWRRLLIIYAQLFGISMVTTLLFLALLIPQYFLLTYPVTKSSQ